MYVIRKIVSLVTLVAGPEGGGRCRLGCSQARTGGRGEGADWTAARLGSDVGGRCRLGCSQARAGGIGKVLTGLQPGYAGESGEGADWTAARLGPEGEGRY